MADLIRRADAIRETWKEPTYSDPLNVLTEMRDRLEALPSIEPEIVRCKDCKYQEKFFHTDGSVEGGGHYVYGCELTDGYSHVCLDDDFCSRAERRTDE